MHPENWKAGRETIGPVQLQPIASKCPICFVIVAGIHSCWTVSLWMLDDQQHWETYRNADFLWYKQMVIVPAVDLQHAYSATCNNDLAESHDPLRTYKCHTTWLKCTHLTPLILYFTKGWSILSLSPSAHFFEGNISKAHLSSSQAMARSRHELLMYVLQASDWLIVRELYGLCCCGVPASIVELCLWGLFCRRFATSGESWLSWVCHIASPILLW